VTFVSFDYAAGKEDQGQDHSPNGKASRHDERDVHSVDEGLMHRREQRDRPGLVCDGNASKDTVADAPGGLRWEIREVESCLIGGTEGATKNCRAKWPTELVQRLHYGRSDPAPLCWQLSQSRRC